MAALLMRICTLVVSLLCATVLTQAQPINTTKIAGWREKVSRAAFPRDFKWGSATSAYQVEGSLHAGGRGPSIWEEIVEMPGIIKNSDNASIAVDQYHRYEEDIDLMVDVGLEYYRFSIAWPRIIPDGSGAVSPEGIAYYNRLIDALLAKGVTPVVTLFHWDLPLSLHRLHGGWLNETLVPLFAKYAEACFAAFGDRVRDWITFNEPRIEYQREFLTACYQSCRPSPDCSLVPKGLPCGCTECQEWAGGLFKWVPYRTTHTILLSHAAAAKIYNQKYRVRQGGQIGITLDCEWPEPYSSHPADVEASNRYILFNLGWFLYPLLKGDYPTVMREMVGDRLPLFTAEQKEDFKGTLDFLGMNHYTARFAKNSPPVLANETNYYLDIGCTFTEKDADGRLIGPLAGSDWLYVFAPGLKNLLLWAHKEFPDFPIMVTENGYSDREGDLHRAAYLDDAPRVNYYSTYVAAMLEAYRGGVNVKGYFAWSLLDNFEWKMGYTERFGMYYVDFANNLTRTPKASAHWWKRFLKDPLDFGIVSL